MQGSSIYSIDVQESLSSLEHLCRRYLTDEALAGCSAQAMLMLPLPIREIKTLSRMTSQLIPVSGTPSSHEIYSFHVHAAFIYRIIIIASGIYKVNAGLQGCTSVVNMSCYYLGFFS